MARLPRIELSLEAVLALLAALLALIAGPPAAHAVEVASEQTISIPCAVIDSYEGELEVLDSSRTHLIGAERKGGVPCGGWVSLGKGWAILKHRDGFRINLGANAFVQLPEPNGDGKRSGDQLVLYKGEIFVQSGGGAGEFRAVTANARTRVNRGSAVVVFNHDEEETQAIAFEDTVTLENRFETSRKVRVKAGEGSALNFKLLRVVPSTPRTVSLAAVKPKFADLHLSERDQSLGSRMIKKRQDRSFASMLVKDDEDSEGQSAEAESDSAEEQPAQGVAQAGQAPGGDAAEAESDGEGGGEAAPKQPARKPGRRIAGIKNSDYSRHRASGEEGELHASWVKKMVAGEEVGERILFPDKYYGRPRKVNVQIEDAETRLMSKKKKVEDAEKRRLIEELSQIREE